MKAAGIDVINMSVGEPDFNTPDHIKEAAKKAIDNNYSRYSPVPGYPELRKAIVKKLKEENGLDYSMNEILVSNGAKQSVCNTIMALVNDGEGNCTRTLLGELSADGQVGWRRSSIHRGWI